MAGTSLSAVYDRFMMLCQDYRLVELFETSQNDFETYLESWLEDAIFDFDVCNQSLVYDSTLKEFTATLTTDNLIILANLMIKYWMTKNVNDITQMNLHVVDRDFKLFSEAQNLKEKQVVLDKHKESCSQMLIDYSYKTSNMDWSKWFSQNFAGE
jgi:hypothetical protein